MIREVKMKINRFILVLLIIISANSNLLAQDQLTKLMDGNKRFIEGKSLHQNQSVERRVEVAKGQNPFAVIVTCSDSRVPPEIIFDQGIGDLFVIRVAGNVVGDFEIASIDYAVEHLRCKLVVVMGHEYCGAVDAAAKGGEHHGNIGKLISVIEPAVEEVKNEKGDLLTNAVFNNVNRVVDTLKNSEPVLKEFVEHKGLQIVGTFYDLDDGTVIMVK